MITWIDLLGMFDDELRRVEAAVVVSADSGNMEPARDALHNLKGLAPTLGASALGALAVYLDDRIREQLPLRARDVQRLSDAIEAFMLAAARVRDAERV